MPLGTIHSEERAARFMSFRQLELHRIILGNLRSMGYRQPTPIQSEAIGSILAGRDVIGLAQTGTGKTTAFLAPMVHHLLERPPDETGPGASPLARLRALVLCPTRELAQQVAEEARHVLANSVLRVTCAYGKVGLGPQAKRIAGGVDLLVATPGRVRELLDAGALSLAFLRHVVIDEADRMFDMGFGPQVRTLLAAAPARRQLLLFSATMPGEVEALARDSLVDPVRIEVGRHTTPIGNVREHLMPVDDRNKVPLLLRLIVEDGRQGVLIFCRTRRRVGWVGAALQRHGVSVGVIHGDRTQPQRQKALARFRDRAISVIVATDVAARGLHIPTARTIINYDVPAAPEEYVHRIGRAGHGGGRGEAFTLLSDREGDAWRAIERVVNVHLEPKLPANFTPPNVKPKRRSRDEVERLEEARERRHTRADTRRTRSRGGSRRRSRKNKPIAPGERPGGGVRRTSENGD